eukprot:PLAT6868.1.p2 GENE.PLAT6868.1~~PLAT6868.1.p2  ORF type:complete len:220 (+),score=30.67 PLAT6868.1:122-781(+)
MQPSPRRSSVSIASTASGGGRGSPQAPAKSSKVAAKAAGATSPEKSMARSALATSWHSRRQRAVTISATDLPRPAAAVLLSAIAVVLALLLVIAPALRASVRYTRPAVRQRCCTAHPRMPGIRRAQLSRRWRGDRRCAVRLRREVLPAQAALLATDNVAAGRPPRRQRALGSHGRARAVPSGHQLYFARLLRRRRRTAPATCSSGSRLQQHYCCAQLLG